MKTVKFAFQGLIVLLSVLLGAIWAGSYFLTYHYRMAGIDENESGGVIRLDREILIHRGGFGYTSANLNTYKIVKRREISTMNNEFSRNPPQIFHLNEMMTNSGLWTFHYQNGRTSSFFLEYRFLIQFPIWAALIPLIPFDYLIIKRALRWKKYFLLHTELCARCGYDLRESPVRCPECGRENDCEKRKEEREKMWGQLRFWKRGK